MSKKVATVKAEPKREFVVVRVLRRGLSTYHTFHGPFTKAEANVYAAHASMYGNGACVVEHVHPLPHHEKWILKEVD